MSKKQKVKLYSGLVKLANDVTCIAHRSASNPMTAPEVIILGFVHGEGSVFDLEEIGEIDTSNATEKARLVGKYGDIVNTVFPGVAPSLDTEIEGVKKNRGRRANLKSLKDAPNEDQETEIPLDPVTDNG